MRNKDYNIKNVLCLATSTILAVRVDAQNDQDNLFPFKLNYGFSSADDSILFIIQNPLNCPIRVWFESKEEEYSNYLSQIQNFVINENETIRLFIGNERESFVEKAIRHSNIKTLYGDFNDKYNLEKEFFSLPFPESFMIQIMQGYNGDFSHNDSKRNQYALDFLMFEGDTKTEVSENLLRK